LIWIWPLTMQINLQPRRSTRHYLEFLWTAQVVSGTPSLTSESMPVEKSKVLSGLTAMARRGVHIKCSAFLETIGSSRRSLSIRLARSAKAVNTLPVSFRSTPTIRQRSGGSRRPRGCGLWPGQRPLVQGVGTVKRPAGRNAQVSGGSVLARLPAVLRVFSW
jgi:hypothetical protein